MQEEASRRRRIWLDVYMDTENSTQEKGRRSRSLSSERVAPEFKQLVKVGIEDDKVSTEAVILIRGDEKGKKTVVRDSGTR